MALVAAHCEGFDTSSRAALLASIEEEIARRKYGYDLRVARTRIAEIQSGFRNEYAWQEVFERLYVATHNSVAIHHDEDRAVGIWNSAA